MAFAGGVFSRLYSWVSDALNGIDISSTRMDAEMNGMATGLSTCILKDGTQTVTANIPWNGMKITGLGDGTSPADATTLSQVQSIATAAGTTAASTLAILKDGSQTVTANIPFNGHKLTGIANGTVSTDAAAFGQLTTTHFKTGSFTYDSSTASGTQAITGIGFTPKEVDFTCIFTTGGAAGAMSWGVDDGTTPRCLVNVTATSTFAPVNGGGASINMVVSGGNSASALITAFGADGFTLTWTKTGSPTGTITIMYSAKG